LKPSNLSCKAKQPSLNPRKNLKVKNAVVESNGAALISKTPIGYIDIRVFAHATEDSDKVLNAVRNILPKELSENAVFQKHNLTGHHGNTIILYETRFAEKHILPIVLEKLASGLNALDKELLNSEIERHFEKKNLYLRLGKQSAYLNEIKLSTTDPIHFKIHFKNQSQKEIIDICRQTGLLP
jgi:RNA binding exosome subunit